MSSEAQPNTSTSYASESIANTIAKIVTELHNPRKCINLSGSALEKNKKFLEDFRNNRQRIELLLQNGNSENVKIFEGLLTISYHLAASLISCYSNCAINALEQLEQFNHHPKAKIYLHLGFAKYFLFCNKFDKTIAECKTLDEYLNNNESMIQEYLQSLSLQIVANYRLKHNETAQEIAIKAVAACRKSHLKVGEAKFTGLLAKMVIYMSSPPPLANAQKLLTQSMDVLKQASETIPQLELCESFTILYCKVQRYAEALTYITRWKSILALNPSINEIETIKMLLANSFVLYKQRELDLALKECKEAVSKINFYVRNVMREEEPSELADDELMRVFLDDYLLKGYHLLLVLYCQQFQQKKAASYHFDSELFELQFKIFILSQSILYYSTVWMVPQLNLKWLYEDHQNLDISPWLSYLMSMNTEFVSVIPLTPDELFLAQSFTITNFSSASLVVVKIGCNPSLETIASVRGLEKSISVTILPNVTLNNLELEIKKCLPSQWETPSVTMTLSEELAHMISNVKQIFSNQKLSKPPPSIICYPSLFLIPSLAHPKVVNLEKPHRSILSSAFHSYYGDKIFTWKLAFSPKNILEQKKELLQFARTTSIVILYNTCEENKKLIQILVNELLHYVSQVIIVWNKEVDAEDEILPDIEEFSSPSTPSTPIIQLPSCKYYHLSSTKEEEVTAQDAAKLLQSEVVSKKSYHDDPFAEVVLNNEENIPLIDLLQRQKDSNAIVTCFGKEPTWKEIDAQSVVELSKCYNYCKSLFNIIELRNISNLRHVVKMNQVFVICNTLNELEELNSNCVNSVLLYITFENSLPFSFLENHNNRVIMCQCVNVIEVMYQVDWCLDLGMTWNQIEHYLQKSINKNMKLLVLNHSPNITDTILEFASEASDSNTAKMMQKVLMQYTYLLGKQGHQLVRG